MIEELLAAFADGGPDAGPDEIADILWLAARVDAAHRRPVPGPHGPATHGHDAAARREGTQHGTPTTSTQPADQLFSAAVRERSDSDGDDGPGVGDRPRGVPLRLPRAEVLHEPLAVMRSLRPVGRHSNGGPGEELDEQLTVEQSIEQLMLSPVLRPARTRGSDLTLVVDAHHSMLLWDDLTEELRRAFTRSGVFRDVRTWFLTGTAAGGTPMVAHRRGAAPRHPRELADPSGRRLILVCTDLVAGGWRESGVQTVLRQWGRHNAVAVLNVLPERLWTRGAIRPVPFAVRADRPAAAGRSWQHVATARRPHRRGRQSAAAAPAVVPVVSASPDSLARLAHLVSGDGRWWNVHCLRLDAAAPPEEPVAAPAPTVVGLDAVERFRAAASPMAQQLAAHLAAVPLTLPVMTLVRRSLLTDSDHGHLAEVALGGLLEPWSAQPADTAPDDLHFDFLPGVREALLGSQLRGDVATVRELVRRSVWEYIARSRFGGREFSATRVTGRAAGSRRVDEGQQPFAEQPALPVAAPPTDTEATSGSQGTQRGTDFEPSARVVVLRRGHGSGMNAGAGVLLTPRLVLTCAHVVDAGTAMWTVSRDGREIACTTVWTGQGPLDAALVLAEENLLDGEEWERLLPSRLRWGRMSDSGPMPVRVSGFGRSGERRELLGTALPTARTITVELTGPFDGGGLAGMSGALVSCDGFFVGTVARRHVQRPRIGVVPAAALLEDTGFRRALAAHMTTPYEIEDMGGEPAAGPSRESPAVCLAIDVAVISGRWGTDAPYVEPELAHDMRESLTAIMRRAGIDGVVTEGVGDERAADLLMMLDGPTAVQDVGRVLAGLQTVVAGHPDVTVAVAVSIGEVTDTRLGLVGGAVSEAARLVGDSFLNAQLRQAARFVDSPVYLAVSDAMRDRIALTLGPAWEDGFVPLGARSEPEPGGGWLYEGPIEELGRAIAAAAEEGGLTGPGLSWVCCGIGATAEDPVGCTGIKLPGYEKCLAHVSDSERAAFLTTLAPGASVDFSGTTFTPELLNEVVSAVREAEGGRVRLGRAIFNEAVLPQVTLQQALFDEASFKGATFGGRALFDEAVFRSDAAFEHAMFLSSALFSGARFEGSASFDYATFGGDVDMGDLMAEGEVTYRYATFDDHATFEAAAFRGPLSFDYTTFQGRSFFTRAEFGRRVTFSYATFQRRTGFDRVHFLERVSFDYSTFNDGLGSLEALFEDRASFAYATFDGPVLLAGGEFRSTASFDFSTFLRPLICRGLFFHGHVGFQGVTFREGAEFSDVTFLEGAELPGALVTGERTDLEVPPTEPEE